MAHFVFECNKEDYLSLQDLDRFSRLMYVRMFDTHACMYSAHVPYTMYVCMHVRMHTAHYVCIQACAVS
jgi:hypothetical protein